MKIAPIFTLVLVLVTGCAALNTLRYDRDEYLGVISDTVKVYVYDGSKSVGDEVPGVRLTTADTVHATTFLFRGSIWGNWYVVEHKGKSYYVKEVDLYNLQNREWEQLSKTINTKFTLSASEDKDAWARANYYVNKHSDMKVQITNDYMVETYNPIDYGKIGFRITKLAQGNSVSYEVRAFSKGVSNEYKEEETLSKKAAYFIKTGKEF